MVGSSEDDDVFTDGSNDAFDQETVSCQGSQVAVYQDVPQKVDPQTMYAGSSCMFVANLPQQYSDRKLEEEVTRAFSQFGIVFVKIKRDCRSMPFAFCQYTNDDDAQTALNKGKGILIFERPCRTEMARAHTAFIVYKISGQRIRLHEARDLLRRLGEVSKTEYLNEGLRAVALLPQTAVVTYRMYDPKRDPVKAFAMNPTYRVQVYDPKALATQGSAPITGQREGSFLKKYDRDRRSAYVGNLPPTMTKDVLKSLASSCGEVLDVQLHHKDVPGGGGLKTSFGFLEFSRPDGPDELVEAMNNTHIDGYRIRAERKQSKSADAPRYASSTVQGTSYARLHAARARVGSFELEKPAEGHFDTPTENTSRRPRRKLYASNSFFHPEEATLTAPVNEAGSAHADSEAELRTAGSKSVEFDLPCCVMSRSSADFGHSDAARKTASKPTTPNAAGTFATQSAKRQSFARESEDVAAPPPPMPWVPSYPPFGYPYMGAPITPQTNPGLMYAGYMQHPMYHVYDMYGNIMLSPTPMMPTFNPTPTMNETAARAGEDNKATDESDTETLTVSKSKEPGLDAAL
ncbi:hypothetical protein CDD83_7594 [Cordyceps sp. RAO-2017]|nr:hypothetical protein CDD83_7594 [Cordyceps sp. RAO-2017]